MNFNFNTAANSTGTNANAAPSTFGSSLGKPTFGASLFGKSSLLAGIVKKEEEKAATEKNQPSTSSSLANRLTKPKESTIKARGDTAPSDGFPLQEGGFKIRKAAFGQLTRRRKEGTPEDNPYSRPVKTPLDSKPVRPTMQAPIFSAIGKREQTEQKSLFGSKVVAEGVDETDHAVKRDLPTSMFGVPLVGGPSSIKGLGSISSLHDKPTALGKPLGDKMWKAPRPRARESPAPEGRPPAKGSGGDEGKLVQKLANLRGQVCPGDYEKYIILDERDKILCQLREINSPLIRRLERCEEMCTEKERYQRITQKGVSPFECDVESGEVSHDLMVKQYARSAADQERPLPHELRSEKIMNHSMCYLLHNILDDFPESAEQRAAWYNFLWSRTRALRKEVTQLSMSDLLAVNLVERCTRMHILFGYLLCDLEIEHFDAAMNNETLGKCLQTLRHLYEDFAKRGVPCANEPEFRAYDVMLHMNDTNVLSQVLSYRSDVRQSQPVRLALQLAGAFRDKNYCRFFRLLKTEASFLQCCVAHKLFGSTRSNAVAIMVHSYGRNVYPLEKMKDVLAFDSVDELTEMLHIYGLRTESGSDHVLLNRDDLTLNETVPMRLYEWIDRKKTGKWSQVVYGSEVFQFFASRCDISNSFNHRNEYTSDKVIDVVLDGSNIPMATNAGNPSFSFAQSAGSLSMQATLEQKKKQDAERLKKMEEAKKDQLVQKMMNGIIDQVVFGVADEETRYAKILRARMRAIEEAKKRKEEQDQKQKELEEARRRKEEDTARKITENIEKSTVENELLRIAREEVAKERSLREQRLAQQIVDKLWGAVVKSVDKHVMRICVEMVDEKVSILEGLESFRDRLARQWLLQFWDRWREWVQMKKEKRERRKEMVRMCVPRWESEEVANELVRKYVHSSHTTISPVRLLQGVLPDNSTKLKAFKKKRINRIERSTFEKWRGYAKKKKALRILAEEQQRRENEFFRRFEKETRAETRFKFEEPQDLMKPKRRKNEEKTPLKENRTITLFAPNSSTFVAKRQLEEWEPGTEMPSELKEKVKRKRATFEKACQDHSTKKKKDGEEISNEARKNTVLIEKTSSVADALLDETLQYTADLERMIADMKARRVEDL